MLTENETPGAWRMTAESARELIKLNLGYLCLQNGNLPDGTSLWDIYLDGKTVALGVTKEAMWYDHIPNWPANIADAWLLFVELRENENTKVLLSLCIAIFRIVDPTFAVPLHMAIHDLLAALSPAMICAAWLSWKLDRPVEIIEESEARDAN